MGKLYLGNQEVTPILYDKEAAIGIPREVNASGVYGYPAQNFSFSLPSDAKNVGAYALYYAFYNCSSLTSVNLSSLTTVSRLSAFYYAFQFCSSLPSVSLNSLTTVSGSSAFSSAFSHCNGLTSVSFPALATITGNSAFYSAFQYCSSLTSVSFPALATITGNSAFGYAFQYCSSLTSVSFPALTTTSFGNRTSQFNRMLDGCSGVTVHFPSAIQSTIGSWSDVTNGFGGTNTTVLFDL